MRLIQWRARLGRGVPREDAALERGEELDVGRVEVAVGERLDDEPGGDARLAEPAVLLGEIDADEPERSHLGDEGAVDAPLLLARLVARRELLLREAPRRFEEGALLVGKTGDHHLRAASPYFRCLRKSGLRFSLKALTPSFDSALA